MKEGRTRAGCRVQVLRAHEMAFARDVADRVLVMDQGQIVEEGPAADVMENPRNPRTRGFLARYHRDAASEKEAST